MLVTLQVDGSTTTINSTTLTVNDLNLTLANGAADSAAANGAGITIDGASASLLYSHSGTKFVLNKPLDVTGIVTTDGLTVDGSATFVSNSGANNLFIDGRSADNIGQVTFRSNDGATNYSQIQSRSTELKIKTLANIPMSFHTNNSPRITILNTGNVGIGQTVPVNRLHVSGADGYAYLKLTSDSTGHTASDGSRIGLNGNDLRIINAEAASILFQTQNTERMRITSTGEIVTGGLTSSTGQLHLYKADATGGKLVLQSQVASDATAKISMMSRLLDNTNKTAYIEAYRGNINFGGESGYGNVGIGTTTPAHPFHITKELAGYQAYFNNDNGSAQGIKVRIKSNDSGNFNMLELVSASTGSDVTAMVVRDDGNVGIGTASPGAKLEISGKDDAGASDLLRLQFDNSPGDTGITFTDINSTVKNRITMDSTNTADLRISSGTKIHLYGGTTNGTSSPHLTVSNNGNVGIGTTSPIEKLDVSGYQGISVNANYAHMGSTVSGAMAIFGHNIKSDSGTNIIKSANNGYHSSMIKMYYNEGITFHATAGTQSAGADFYNISGTTNELMRLTNDGNVGIGETNPSHRLHINGGSNDEARVRVSNTAGGQASLDLNNSEGYFRTYTDAGEYRIYDQTDGVHRLIINTSGNVGIGTDTPTMGKLQVHGSKYVNTNSGKALGGIHVSPNSAATLGQFGGAISLSAGGNGSSAIAAVNDGGTDNDSTGLAFFVHSSGTGANDATEVVRIDEIGNVGIGTSNPGAPLDITPNSSTKKTIRVDNASQRGYQEYVISGTIGANAVTITMQCPSYFQSEVVATFQQSNGGADNNVYFNGIWSNNHTTHLFKNKTDGGTVPRIGSLGNATPAFTVGVGDAASNTGKLTFTKAAAGGTSGTFCVHVRAYGYGCVDMTYVVS